jgi:hypothetical protein
MSHDSRACRRTHTDRRHADRAPAPPGPGPPGCSCRAACRCDQPPATPARRTGPGSSPRQRLDDRRRQCRRDRTRYPHPCLADLNFDHRLGARGRVSRGFSRRDQHLGKACYGTQFLPPPIDLARRNIGAPRNLRNHRPRRKTLRDNRPFLILAPPCSNWSAHARSRPGIKDCRVRFCLSCTGIRISPI